MLVCIFDQDNSTQKTGRQRNLPTVCPSMVSDFFSDRSPWLLQANTWCKTVALFPCLIFQDPQKTYEINILLLGHLKSWISECPVLYSRLSTNKLGNTFAAVLCTLSCVSNSEYPKPFILCVVLRKVFYYRLLNSFPPLVSDQGIADFSMTTH